MAAAVEELLTGQRKAKRGHYTGELLFFSDPMNRTTFLFLALLIASCIVTVNSRHEARTLITQKTVLSEKVTSLQEAIRRLELENARFSAKTCPLAIEVAAPTSRPAPSKVSPAKHDDTPPAPHPAAAKVAEPDEDAPSAVQHPVAAPKAHAPHDTAPAGRSHAVKAPAAKHDIAKDEDALTKMMDKALKK